MADQQYHSIDYFNTTFREVDVTAENFQSEVQKGLWVYKGAWEKLDITDESQMAEYTMFNEENQVIYNETVPILRDGSRGEKGEDGKNAVEYRIDTPFVYKPNEVVTAIFYKYELEIRTEIELYYTVTGKRGDEWVDIQRGKDSQINFQATDSETGKAFPQVKITVYRDSNRTEDLDTEYIELIEDGENGVSKFYEIDAPVVFKDGDQPTFYFYINEDGKRTPQRVNYRFYKNEDYENIIAQGTGTEYKWADIIHDYDQIAIITCRIFIDEDSLIPLDQENCEYVTGGINGIQLHCLNDEIHLACNEFGVLKKALQQDITLQCYSGTDLRTPYKLEASVYPPELASNLNVILPTTYSTTNKIRVTMNNGKTPVEGYVTVTATVEGVELTKIININIATDGKNLIKIVTKNDTLTINANEDGKLKSALQTTIGLMSYYGETAIPTYTSVTFNPTLSVKAENMSVGTWNSATGEIKITQSTSTTAVSGKLVFNVHVSYMGLENNFIKEFPIVVTQDGITVSYYEIRGESGVYTLDNETEISFYKVHGNNSELAECYYTSEYSDYMGSTFLPLKSGVGKSIKFTAQSNYHRVRVYIYSDAEHKNLLDKEMFYLVTDAPQVVVLNNFQSILTDVDNHTTSYSTINIYFEGYISREKHSVTCKTGTGQLILPNGFSFVKTTPSTSTTKGCLVVAVQKGIEIEDQGSISLTFEMEGKLYPGNFSFSAQKDGINNFTLLLNADNVVITADEVYPDVVYPNIIHTTTSYESMIDKDIYNASITDEDDKLKVRAISYPTLKEIEIDYNTASSYNASTQYYTRVYPMYAYGYKNNAKDTTKGWTVKQTVDGQTKEYVMVFYTPRV